MALGLSTARVRGVSESTYTATRLTSASARVTEEATFTSKSARHMSA